MIAAMFVYTAVTKEYLQIIYELSAGTRNSETTKSNEPYFEAKTDNTIKIVIKKHLAPVFLTDIACLLINILLSVYYITCCLVWQEK